MQNTMRMDIKGKLVFELFCSQFTEGKILTFMAPMHKKGRNM